MSSSPRLWRDIQPLLIDVIVSQTQSSITTAFSKIDDTLFDLSKSGTSVAQIDALRGLRNLRPTWSSHVDTCVRQWAQTTISDTPVELTLVSNDELETRLAAEQMAESFHKAQSVLFQQLNGVWSEIAAWPPNKLSGAQNAQEAGTSSPVHHKGLAHMVVHWLNAVDMDAQDRVVVLKIIERELTKGLNGLLSNSIALMQRMGWRAASVVPPTNKTTRPDRVVSPNLMPAAPTDAQWLDQVEHTQAAPLSPPSGHGHADRGYVQHQHYPQNIHPTYQVQYGVSTSYEADQQLAHDLPVHMVPSLAQQLFHLMGSSVGSVGETTDTGAAPTWATVLNTIPQGEWDPRLPQLINVLQRRRQSASVVQSGVEINNRTVRSVLNALQQDLPASVRQAARQNDQTLTQQFKEEILHKARVLGGVDGGRLTDHDEDAVDIVGMLFEIFLSERKMADEMRETVARLLAPYVKVAINDRKMFMHKSHPARKFLDVVAEACEGNMGVNHNERNTLDKVTQSIDQLAADFHEDVAVFELVESEVRAFIEQQRVSSELAERRAADAQRGKERLEQAQKDTQALFHQALGTRNWPINAVDTLFKYWGQHHRMTILRGEHDTKDQSHSIALLDVLVGIGSEGWGMVAQPEQLRGQVVDMMRASGVVDSTNTSVGQEIWDALEQARAWTTLAAQGKLSPIDVQQLSTPASRQKERVSDENTPKTLHEQYVQEEHNETLAGSTEPLNTSAEEAQAPHGQGPNYFSSPQELAQYFRTMEIGTWVDFVRPDGAVVSTKLSWVSPISQRLLFVTQRGTKHAVESAEDLAVMVKLDRVRLRTIGVGEHGFAHSYRKALDQLQAQTPSASATESAQVPLAEAAPVVQHTGWAR